MNPTAVNPQLRTYLDKLQPNDDNLGKGDALTNEEFGNALKELAQDQVAVTSKTLLSNDDDEWKRNEQIINDDIKKATKKKTPSLFYYTLRHQTILVFANPKTKQCFKIRSSNANLSTKHRQQQLLLFAHNMLSISNQNSDTLQQEFNDLRNHPDDYLARPQKNFTDWKNSVAANESVV